MANSTIAVDAPGTLSVPWYAHPLVAKVTATFNSTSYNTANNVGILVDFAPLFTSSQVGTISISGALGTVTDQPWGLNANDALDVLSVVGTSANTYGLALAGVKTVANQPTQRTLILAAPSNAANAANGGANGIVEFSGSTLTGTMDLFLIFAKGSRSFQSAAGTGA